MFTGNVPPLPQYATGSDSTLFAVVLMCNLVQSSVFFVLFQVLNKKVRTVYSLSSLFPSDLFSFLFSVFVTESNISSALHRVFLS